MSDTSVQPLALKSLAYLQSHWAAFFPGERAPRSLEFMLQGTGVGKLVLFVFADGAARPHCVVKLPRSRRDNDSVRREYEMIVELRRGGDSVRRSVPAPIATCEIDGRRVTIERMLPGKLLSSAVPVGGKFDLGLAAQHLKLVREWLVATHTATAAPSAALSAREVQALFLAPIDNVRREAELRPPEQAHLSRLHAAAEGLVGRQFPLSFSHGDFRPGNMLLAQGRLSVIDWQFGQMRAVPMLDWFEFVFRYYCDAAALEEIAGEQTAYAAAFEAVYLGGHAYARLVEAETQAYAQALGIPPDNLGMLVSLWLVSNINKYLAFLADRVERGYLFLMQPTPGTAPASFRRQLRRQVYMCLLGQLAEHHTRWGLSQTDASEVHGSLAPTV